MKPVKKRENEKSLEEMTKEIEELQQKIRRISEPQEKVNLNEEEILEEPSEEEQDDEDTEKLEPPSSPAQMQDNTEIPEVDSEFLEGLGKDPLIEKASEVVIHPILLKRWQHYLSKGLEAYEKEEIQLRNKRPVAFDPPSLNPWLLSASDPNTETKKKRDNHLLDRQRLAASALTALGGAMTMLSYSDEVDRLQFIEKLRDAAKFISQLIYDQTEARKAFLTPGFNKTTREILESAESDTLLFGQGLDEKISQAKKLEQVAQDMKPSINSVKNSSNKKFLNSRSLGGRSPFPTGTGNYNASTQGRQKFFFKSRNQFHNPRANAPLRGHQSSHRQTPQKPK